MPFVGIAEQKYTFLETRDSKILNNYFVASKFSKILIVLYLKQCIFAIQIKEKI